jgi:hypothetical protein
MFANHNGKLLVYASSGMSEGERLKSVSVAAEKMAKELRLDVEVVTFEEQFTPIYIYYKNAEEEPIPLYCDKGGESTMQEIYDALRKMMFVLSFHPKHSALKQIREEVIHFS